MRYLPLRRRDHLAVPVGGYPIIAPGRDTSPGHAKPLPLTPPPHIPARLRLCYTGPMTQPPTTPAEWFELGVERESNGDASDALAAYTEATNLEPGMAEAHHNQGRLLRGMGRAAEGAKAGLRAVALRPDHPALRLSLGLSLESVGQVDAAREQYEAALELRPDYAEAAGNLGRLLYQMGEPLAGISALEGAVASEPAQAGLWLNLSNAQIHAGRPDDALGSLDKALELAPGQAQIFNSRGTALSVMGRDADAIGAFRRAVELAPGLAEAHENLGQALLQAGEMAEGWGEYGWRWQNPNNALTKPSFEAPKWDGSPLAGRRLLLHGEQGLGDSIQFIRYAGLIDKSGRGEVILACQRPLMSLLAGADGVDRVVELGADPGPFDVWAALLDLPGILPGDAIPAATPYLRPISAPSHHRRPSGAECLVAFAWAGRAKYVHDAWRDRSCPAGLFRCLAQVPGVHLAALQKGDGADQVFQLADLENVSDWGPACADFEADAAALAGVDLVITVDTALAHLAGALGLPCWIILPHAPDWRWGRGGVESVWYPTVRLFQQPSPGDWQSVFSELEEILEEFANSTG